MVIAQGLLNRWCRPANMASCAFSISLAREPFALGNRASGEGGVVRTGEEGFSTTPLPFRLSDAFQLMLLDLRLIEKDGRSSVLRRCSSLVGDGTSTCLRAELLEEVELT